MKNKKTEISEEFLKIFVRLLIKESYNPERQIHGEMKKEMPQFVQAQIVKKPQMQSLNIVPQKQTYNPNTIKQFMPSQFPRRNQRLTKIFPEQRLPENRPIIKEISSPSGEGGMGLNKISNLLLDPSVLSIECPGPTKNLLVNRSGSIQATSMTLTKEEIDSLIEEIGEKTRIPVTTGIFKAAVQNILITAVISEFVGTRFLIQKRTPFKRY